jgi:cytochrome c peroxidase
MRFFLPLLLGGSLLAPPAFAEALREAALEQFKPLPSTIPALNDNPVTPAKIDLGKSLFFDPRLSASGVFSCYSCHNLTTGGDDNMETSVGHGWQKGPRNAPTALNAVLNEAQFWDGRAADLAAQAKGPIQAGVEMANTPANVETTLGSLPAYVTAFSLAFPNESAPVNFDNMAKAIEAFEATLLTPAPSSSSTRAARPATRASMSAGMAIIPSALSSAPGPRSCPPVTRAALP